MHLAVELFPNTSALEQCLIALKQADKDHRATLYHIEATKQHLKAHYDRHIHPHSFCEGDFVLVYNQSHDQLGRGKFQSMWHNPYVVKHCLGKGAYLLADPDGKLHQ